MIHHIRPYRLFQYLGGDNHAHITIPTVRGTESHTIFAIETLLLIAAARIVQAKTILEIGTSLGLTTMHLAMNIPAAISTIDIERKACAFEGTGWESSIRRITADIAEVEPFNNDMVFCDCNYTLDLCRMSSALAFACHPKVIAWHDYGNADCPDQFHNVQELSETHEIIHIEDTRLCFWFAATREI
jgi:hypothetical protein